MSGIYRELNNYPFIITLHSTFFFKDQNWFFFFASDFVPSVKLVIQNGSTVVDRRDVFLFLNCFVFLDLEGFEMPPGTSDDLAFNLGQPVT